MQLSADKLTMSTPILEHTLTLKNPSNFQCLQQINVAIHVHPENNWSGAWIMSVSPIHCSSSCSDSNAAFKAITNWKELINLSWNISVGSCPKVNTGSFPLGVIYSARDNAQETQNPTSSYHQSSQSPKHLPLWLLISWKKKRHTFFLQIPLTHGEVGLPLTPLWPDGRMMWHCWAYHPHPHPPPAPSVAPWAARCGATVTPQVALARPIQCCYATRPSPGCTVSMVCF